MKWNAGGPAIGIAGTEIQSSGVKEHDLIAFRDKLHSLVSFVYNFLYEPVQARPVLGHQALWPDAAACHRPEAMHY